MEKDEYLGIALKETSPVIKSFWYGKFLQAHKSKGLEDSSVKGCNSQADHIADAKANLLESQTFLSQSVYSLVTQSVPPLLARDVPSFINADLILDWSAIEKYLSANIVSDKQTVNGVAKRLGVVAKQVHIMVTSIDQSKVMMILSDMYHWTHKPELYKECIELILSSSSCPIDVHLSLLICTAALERSLGDVYLHVSGARQCPRLLKDLLATRELGNVFGKIPLLCLQCLIGPPNGFNLRNILWHGFTAQGEVSEELALFLLIVAGSLGTCFDKYSPLLHRPFILFPQELTMELKFPDFSTADMESMKCLFENSFFVVPSMLSIWLKALDNYQNEKYGYFICLILPCLENALRRVFACCNHCPQRILTAESSVLYTTFDEILCQTLQDGKELNQLQYEVTTPYMEMLMDVLVHPEGPRLRDRVSHGEANLDLISKTIANFVLGMCVALCGRYSILSEKECPVSEATSLIANKYVSLFHPCSILKREMLKLFVEMRNWKDIASYHGDEEEGQLIVLTECVRDYSSTVHFLLCCIPEMSHSIDKSIMNSCICDEFNTHPLEALVELVWSKPIHTLYMCRNDLEITGILRRVVYHLTAAISQIHCTATQRYEMYQLKQLRSRQRGNFDRLLSCIGLFWSCAVLVSVLICIGVYTYPTNPESSNKKIRYFKKVLQFTENFFSQTSPSRNRWEEATVLCNTLVQLCMKLQCM